MGRVGFSVSLGFMILFFASGKTQNVRYDHRNNGKIKLYLGWNTTCYTMSGIHFKRCDYNFTPSAVKALPDVTNSHYFYFSQTNSRLGYFINDHYEIAVGSNHVRYIFDDYHEIDMYGYTKGNQYDRSKEEIPGNLLTYYKRTNGLNYIHVGLTPYDNTTRYIRTNPRYTQVGGSSGARPVILYPKSFVRFIDYPSINEWGFVGFGTTIKGGLITLFKYFLFSLNLKKDT